MCWHEYWGLAARPHKSEHFAVRVIGCDGAGSLLDVVKALEWVHSNLQAPAIVLMSLGSPVAAILDAAAQSLTDIGITVVVAGGNSAGGWPCESSCVLLCKCLPDSNADGIVCMGLVMGIMTNMQWAALQMPAMTALRASPLS